MKILSRALFVLFIVLGMLVAVSNMQRVEVELWPLPEKIVLPLYLLIVGILLAGLVAGLVLGWWIGFWVVASTRGRWRTCSMCC